MKKLLLIAASILMLSTANIKAQITLDTILPRRPIGMGYDFKTVQISKNETKFFFADTVTNTFSLYNMDFTPFLTNIAVPEPFLFHNIPFLDNYFQVLYITRALFDCDTTNIEYAYYVAGNLYKPFRIVRTDGTVLFQKDSANGPYCIGSCLGLTDMIRPIVNTSSGAKLFLQNNAGQKFIYSLCGTLPVDVFDFSNLNNSYITLFPNPTSQSLTFKVNAPDNMNEYELVIVNSIAREVYRESISPQKNNYTINVENLSTGIYYYSLYNKNSIFQTGKFVIVK